MAYTKYSLTPANNTATPPDGAPEGMLPSAVNDTMRDMMAQIRDVGDGIRDGTYTMTAAKITGGSITGITDLAIADGGTGASTAAGARTNLGLDGFVNMKNRIINGAMVIDQRNAGAAQNSLGDSASIYLVDRWQYYGVVASKFNSQQNAGSVTPPVGFSNYLGLTSTSAYSVTSTDFFQVAQSIEGFNTADLAWGTANAKTVTLSFWVYSSLTGTFGGTLNGAQYYPFTYSIPTANTWTQISVTVAGSTSGSWGTGNSTSIGVVFSLGAGSSVIGTAGAWSNTVYRGATGQVNVVATNGATFYITGVQLEVGSTATSFDYRPYGTELALCQRYFQKYDVALGPALSASNLYVPAFSYKVTMRAAPTLASGGTFTVSTGSAGTPAIFIGTAAPASPDAQWLYNATGNWTVNANVQFTGGFTAEL